ncbi:hypothetical protein, conserved [Trypanosoma brucei brucei TREU927]|uniref:JAB1/MPN/MOV34 metalloenzyme domain-containing protein n=1 Tax=Trypanosoma brucei brucei (strain 927/4 GUTat10.1) TaxID=185431 RepID=Q580Y4_TRYB2|nr:hypothetical protein, conserved [Trypanosoma brucei brucei TREU927]AAX78969.1 hypothetical protein, conserved [Trypanosoma brucei]AAZ13129.1 hypothetical protein, conserved [Trypanosoma brucei brucei TREU927]
MMAARRGELCAVSTYVHVHPQVVLSITKHAARVRRGMREVDGVRLSRRYAAGILLGSVSDVYECEVTTSFEAVDSCSSQSGAVSALDWPAMKRKREQVANVLPGLHVVGWYAVGCNLSDAARWCAVFDTGIREIIEDHPSTVLLALIVDTSESVGFASSRMYALKVRQFHLTDSQCQDAPTTTPESTTRFLGGVSPLIPIGALNYGNHVTIRLPQKPQLAVELVRVRHVCETDDITRVGLDASSAGICAVPTGSVDVSGNSTAWERLLRVQRSLRLLRRQVLVVIKYLTASQQGSCIPIDSEVLRHVGKICDVLPSIASPVAPPTRCEDNSVTHNLRESCALMLTLLSLHTKCATALRVMAKRDRRIV